MSEQETALEVQAKPSDLLQIIARAVADPHMDVEKMERLLAMHERITADQRKAAFVQALSRLQARLPQIDKHGEIWVKGKLRSKFAKLEDIDVTIRPLLAEEGFAFSFDSNSTDGKQFTISAKLSHADGHSETKFMLLPVDASEFRSAVQSVASTITFARRQLIKLHLNLIERDEDHDGVSLETISAEQAKDLQAALEEVHADLAKFRAFMGVASLDDILLRDLPKAMTAIAAKRRAQ